MITKTVYLDTSAINHLYDDPNARILTETLNSKSQPLISVFTFMETASTSDSGRRVGLITFLKSITGHNRPVAMPGDLLRRSLEAMSVRASTIDISMGSEYDGVWIALDQPDLIHNDAYKEVLERKRHEEEWYQDMHDLGRPEIQQALTKLSPKERHTLTTFSGLIKYYHSNPNLVNLVCDLASHSGAKVAVDNLLVSTTIQHSEHWRFFLAGMAYGLYARSVKITNFSKHKNPGSVDTQQSIYLATCDVFVTADQQQHDMLRFLTPFGHKKRDVWDYPDLARWLSRMREDC
jgi:hypothetical protein